MYIVIYSWDSGWFRIFPRWPWRFLQIVVAGFSLPNGHAGVAAPWSGGPALRSHHALLGAGSQGAQMVFSWLFDCLSLSTQQFTSSKKWLSGELFHFDRCDLLVSFTGRILRFFNVFWMFFDVCFLFCLVLFSSMFNVCSCQAFFVEKHSESIEAAASQVLRALHGSVHRHHLRACEHG